MILSETSPIVGEGASLGDCRVVEGLARQAPVDNAVQQRQYRLLNTSVAGMRMVSIPFDRN